MLPPPFFSSGEISPFGQFQITNAKNIRCFFEVYNLPFFLKKNFQSHLLGFSTVANNREGFFELFYFHIYLIYSQINLAKSYYG